jgi:hypothetical protein
MFESLDFISSHSIWGILARFGINLIFLILLIGVIYFRYSKKEKFLFTFFLIGIIVFMLCSIMSFVSFTFGFAVGLFAVFGVLRFRTTNFGVKDMAYIFTAIGVSVINGVVMKGLPYGGILVINIIIVISTFILEEVVRKNLFKKHRIVYENVDLLRPEHRNKLLKDLSDKTGRNVLRVKILKVDYRKETAEVDIFFKE